MKILKEGDTKKVACNTCGVFQNATFQLRDVPFSDGSGLVKNVLVGVCDVCDSVAVIPHQSTPVIKKQLDKLRRPLEGRVPSHLIDILNLASDQLGAATDFVPSLIKFYIHALSKNEMPASELSGLLNSELAKGKATKRISLKGRYIVEEAEMVKASAHISSTTELLKSVVLKINDDILVRKRPECIKALESLVAATA
ncbi:MAG: hypothetical protein H7A01_12235 [Hahellaceae bacterium]|nr:hypothetical protein [Hahellaceae bacterium]MCP5209912.1 hypothetical protein [Hahellaceae bacterium]